MNRQVKRSDFGKSKAEQCAKEIIAFLIKHGMWIDTMVYVNGKRYSCWDGEDYHYDNNWKCVYEDAADPKDYFEYVGDFLSMSFEGPLYDILNYHEYCGLDTTKYEEEFEAILAKYGKYKELGNAWNLSLYDL